MSFPQKLAELRSRKKFSQMQLAETIGIHVSQLRRYEAGTSQPTLDVLKNLARALSCTTDELIFGNEVRGPIEDLRLQFEAISNMSEEERAVAKHVLEGLILRHQAKHWTHAV